MDTDRWRRFDEIFEQALDRDDGERSRFLDEACAGETSMRREIEALVAADRRSGLLDRDPRQLLDRAAAAPPADAWIGERFGPYRVEREIGHGGRASSSSPAATTTPSSGGWRSRSSARGACRPRSSSGSAASARSSPPSSTRRSPGSTRAGRAPEAGPTWSWSTSTGCRSTSTAATAGSTSASAWSSSARSAPRCTTPISTWWSTATSSPRTYWSPRAASPSSSTRSRSRPPSRRRSPACGR